MPYKDKEKHRIYHRNYLRKHGHRYKHLQRAWYERNKEAIHEKARAFRRACLEAYSNGLLRCACCGETEYGFLSLDHINGGGNRERHGSSPQNLSRRLAKAGFPPGYRVLCYNCNLGREFRGGTCPHQSNGTSELPGVTCAAPAGRGRP